MFKHSTAATMVNDLHWAAGWLLNQARIYGIEVFSEWEKPTSCKETEVSKLYDTVKLRQQKRHNHVFTNVSNSKKRTS